MVGSAAGRAVWKFGVMAAVGAGVVNAIILVAAKASGVDFVVPDQRTGGTMEIAVVQVILLTAFPLLVGTALAAVVERFGKPIRWVEYLAMVLALLSLYAPLSVDSDLSTKLVLSSMHVISGVALVTALERAAQVDAPAAA